MPAGSFIFLFFFLLFLFLFFKQSVLLFNHHPVHLVQFFAKKQNKTKKIPRCEKIKDFKIWTFSNQKHMFKINRAGGQPPLLKAKEPLH